MHTVVSGIVDDVDIRCVGGVTIEDKQHRVALGSTNHPYEMFEIMLNNFTLHPLTFVACKDRSVCWPSINSVFIRVRGNTKRGGTKEPVALV